MTKAESQWKDQAAFMRSVGAIHAEWDLAGMILTKLVLGPAPTAKSATQPTQPKSDMPRGAVARLMKQHEIQFAHSRVRPPMPKTPEADVPRAVSAKRTPAHGTKAQKRAS